MRSKSFGTKYSQLDVVFSAARDELMLDGNSSQKFGTFCQAWANEEICELMDLWRSPDAVNAIVCSTAGSSESAVQFGLALKWAWRKRREAEGKSTDRPNLISGLVQISWHKFTRYCDVERRGIPHEGDLLIMCPEDVLKRIDDAFDILQAETGRAILIHIDGASGGFLVSFCAPDIEWDFRLPEERVFNVNYLCGNNPSFALNFARAGGQIIAQYYNFLRLGRSGYAKIHNACYTTAQYLFGEIAKLGPFEIIFDGDSQKHIPALAWKLQNDAAAQIFSSAALRELQQKIRSLSFANMQAYKILSDFRYAPLPGK